MECCENGVFHVLFFYCLFFNCPQCRNEYMGLVVLFFCCLLYSTSTKPCRTLHALLIPKATNREPSCLTVGDSEDIAVEVEQDAVPGVCITGLRRTPPAPIVTNVVE